MESVPLPSVGPTQVRVRLEGCGVCGSNLPVWEGRPWFKYPLAPGMPGHEGWGFIDETGSAVERLRVGQRVAFLGQRSFAEYDVAEASDVVVIPDELADVPVPAEPLACAVNAFKRAGVSAGQWVAIVGVGFLGALLVQLASKAGARVIAISRRSFALDVARAMGAMHIMEAGDRPHLVQSVAEITEGHLCDVVIEATGLQEPLDLATELTKERGRLVIAGYHQDGARQVNMQLWNWRGLDVINAHERDPRVYRAGMEEAVSLLKSRQLNPSLLYTHRYPLFRLGEALDAMRDRDGGFLKALVIYD
ncbi:MAG: zinc-binding dehydrogenase [Nibricoccus sp.]